MKKKQRTEFEDASLVAFLILRGHKTTPFKRADGRVVFSVEGDILPTLQELYANTQVGVLDFIKTLKAVRSSIFALKAGG